MQVTSNIKVLPMSKSGYTGGFTMYHAGPNRPTLIVEKDGQEVFKEVVPESVRKCAWGFWIYRNFINFVKNNP